MERSPSDEVLSVMHWLKHEGFGDSVRESVIRKFMVVPTCLPCWVLFRKRDF